MSEEKYKVGDSLTFLGIPAVIRYIGTYHAKPGTWIGIEFDREKGRNNGTIGGVKYFECPEKCGIFITYDKFLETVEASTRKLTKSPSQNNKATTVLASPKPSISVSSSLIGSSLILKSDDNSDDIPPPSPIQGEIGLGSPKEKRIHVGKSPSNVDMLKPTNSSLLAPPEQNEPPPQQQQQHETDLQEKIDSLKKKCALARQKVKLEAKKLRDLMVQKKDIEKSHEDTLKQIKAENQEELMKIQLEYLPEQIRLEQDLFQATKEEKIAKKNSFENDTHQYVEMLSTINDEYCKYENELRELMKKQGKDVEFRMKRKMLLDEKIKKQDTSKEQLETIQSILDKIQDYQNELQEQQPEWQDVKAMKIKISSLPEKIDNIKKESDAYSNESQINRNFVEKIRPFVNPIVKPLSIIYRLIKNVPLVECRNDQEMSIIEEFLHFCDCALLVFSHSIDNYSQTEELTSELEKIEAVFDTRSVPAIDFQRITSTLQSHTPSPLHLSITSHLLMAYAYKTKSEDIRSDLVQVARMIPHILHPSIMIKDKEECENFALKLRKDLRDTEEGKPISLMQYTKMIQILVASLDNEVTALKYDFTPLKKKEGEINKDNIREEAEDKVDSELADLQRQIFDTKGLVDQYKRFNTYLSDKETEMHDSIKDLTEKVELLSEELAKLKPA